MVGFTSCIPPVLLEQFLGSSYITLLTRSVKISSVWWSLRAGRGHRGHPPPSAGPSKSLIVFLTLHLSGALGRNRDLMLKMNKTCKK